MKTELKHGDFKQLDKNLWILEGELPLHLPLPRTMTVFRMDDGGLWIHSAIALDDRRQRELESFGRPAYLVVPSTMHRLDAPVYKQTYPAIRVVCPEAAKEKVEQKVHVDNSCENEFRDSQVVVHKMPGAKPIELSYELPLASGGKAVVFNDLLVNVTQLNGLLGKLMMLVGRVGFFRSPPSNKFLLIDDRTKFKQWLEAQAQRNDLKIITVAHGAPLTEQIPHALAEAARQV